MDSTTLVNIAFFAFFAWFIYNRFVGKTSSADARKLVADGAALLDVRSPGEFAGGHLPGARNIPVDAIGARAAEVGPKDKPVVLYCASGMRSASAARTLKGLGFAVVHDLGGMGRW